MAREKQIYASMHTRLVTGHFVSESRLRATELASEYNCASATMRDILMRLSAVGLVVYFEQRGFRVPTIDSETQHQLTQLRIILECEGAVLSIRQGGVGWESRLSAAHHKLSHIEHTVSTNDVHSDEMLSLWTSAEEEFHKTLIDACRSQILQNTHDRIYHQFRQQLIGNDRNFRFVPENIQQHQNILDAALDRDETLIRSRIAEHLGRNLARPLPT